MTNGYLNLVKQSSAASNADVVKGKVNTVYDSDTQKWIKQTGFFEEKYYPTGTILTHCATNNTLINNRLLKNNYYFDPSYALSGGEDTKLFWKVSNDGYKIVYCLEAEVFEFLHKNRQKMSYMLRRIYYCSNNYIRIEREYNSSIKVLIKRFLTSVFHILTGIVYLPFLIFKGKCGVFNSLSYIMKGIGQLSALLGITTSNY